MSKLRETGAKEIHFTAKKIIKTGSLENLKEVNYSSKELNEHFKIESEFEAIKNIINKIKDA